MLPSGEEELEESETGEFVGWYEQQSLLEGKRRAGGWVGSRRGTARQRIEILR